MANIRIIVMLILDLTLLKEEVICQNPIYLLILGRFSKMRYDTGAAEVAGNWEGKPFKT